MSWVQTGIGIISGIGGIGDAHPKDAERLGRNTIAFGKAIAGDDNALKFLLYRSGSPDSVQGTLRYDSAYMGSLGSQDPERIPVKGWPTARTRDDAKRKYQQAQEKRQQLAAGITGLGAGVGTGSEGATTGDYAQTLGQYIPRSTWGVLLLVAIAAVAIWYFFGRKG